MCEYLLWFVSMRFRAMYLFCLIGWFFDTAEQTHENWVLNKWRNFHVEYFFVIFSFIEWIGSCIDFVTILILWSVLFKDFVMFYRLKSFLNFFGEGINFWIKDFLIFICGFFKIRIFEEFLQDLFRPDNLTDEKRGNLINNFFSCCWGYSYRFSPPSFALHCNFSNLNSIYPIPLKLNPEFNLPCEFK